MITEIAFFVYPVSDMGRARAFYEGVLSLKLDNNWQDLWVEYDVRGVALAITSADMGQTPGAKGGVVGLEVDDFDAEIQRLKARQVRFVMEVFATPVCRMAVIADPDGNHITIHKRNA